MICADLFAVLPERKLESRRVDRYPDVGLAGDESRLPDSPAGQFVRARRFVRADRAADHVDLSGGAVGRRIAGKQDRLGPLLRTVAVDSLSPYLTGKVRSEVQSRHEHPARAIDRRRERLKLQVII